MTLGDQIKEVLSGVAYALPLSVLILGSDILAGLL